jgi:hypothetical protein
LRSEECIHGLAIRRQVATVEMSALIGERDSKPFGFAGFQQGGVGKTLRKKIAALAAVRIGRVARVKI